MANAEFLEDVAAFAKAAPLLQDSNNGNNDTIQSPSSSSSWKSKPKPKITEHEMEKLRSTLRQLHRDWSEEGKVERERAYKPILDAVQRHCPINSRAERRPRVLVPGCGLGRLPFEIAQLGYSCQGNEFR